MKFLKKIKSKLLPIMGTLTALLLIAFRPDAIMIIIYVLAVILLLLTNRKKDLKQLLVASVISLLWILFANNQYGYNQNMIKLFGLNSFPLFAWPLGLFSSYKIITYFQKRFNIPKKHRFIFYTLLYVFLLLSIETIAYHQFNIKNLTSASYSGLPICNCLHAPPWMQLSYILLGPIYYVVLQKIKLSK